MTKPTQSLTDRDTRVTWHPYTQHGLGLAPLEVVAAKGAKLKLGDGSEIIDGISSWWATLHGHGEERLVRAATRQMQTLDHVLFAGATHEPAVRLAEELLKVAPKGLSRVFYSDNGSTAIEVALKMVVQNFAQNGEPKRNVFVALNGAYHGDTFGSMAVGDPDPFFELYAPLLFESKRIDPDPEALNQVLEELKDRAAGVILEPLLQGAAGMRVYDPSFLRHARAACDAHGIALIADEVMTGFGRTGTLFACEQAAISPDLLCLAKGLTGGTFPLSATLARESMFEGFLSQEKSRLFFHGHTFTAHPVGCAIALESLKMVQENDTPARLQNIGATLAAQVKDLADHPGVENFRHLGGMVAFDLLPPPGSGTGYLSSLGPKVAQTAIDSGVLLRPLGNVVYALPPACTNPGEVDQIAQAMRNIVKAIHP